MVNHKRALRDISHYAGNRYDLVQAGGGNTSVKLDSNKMLVKASGINLSEVTPESGYVPVDYHAIRELLAKFDASRLEKKQREEAASSIMKACTLADTGKPSIETFLHALLSTYTLHTHPISINVLAASKNWKKDLLRLWPDAICVPYHTPGIDLALALKDEMNAYVAINGRFPNVIFLQNHGLIVSSHDAQEVIRLTQDVTLAMDQHINIDLSRYRNVSRLHDLISHFSNSKLNILCSDDSVIKQTLSAEKSSTKIWPFCPDTLIYCGVRPVFINNVNDKESIKSYINAYQELPKVIVLNRQVYFCAASLKKAKEAQDLFKFHLLVVNQSQEKIQRLNLSEIAYLSNWDAEKYRQGV